MILGQGHRRIRDIVGIHSERITMKLSLYTYVRNGVFFDLHVVEMLKHHLPLADEIIVNEGYSSDETYELISGIDPKIKVFRTTWGEQTGFDWYIRFKEAALRECTGEWCIQLDCDEFIPEWEFDKVRDYIESTTDVMTTLKFVNFYGNYKVYHASPRKVGWPEKKMVIHKNIPEIEFWGDGSSVRLRGSVIDWSIPRVEFACHHFGTVRNPARLRQKWSNQGWLYSKKRRLFSLPSFLFNLRPHDWKDPQFFNDLAIYEGPYIQAVRENPDEFVRDGYILYEMIKQNGGVDTTN
jgi:hypothetical protein